MYLVDVFFISVSLADIQYSLRYPQIGPSPSPFILSSLHLPLSTLSWASAMSILYFFLHKWADAYVFLDRLPSYLESGSLWVSFCTLPFSLLVRPGNQSLRTHWDFLPSFSQLHSSPVCECTFAYCSLFNCSLSYRHLGHFQDVAIRQCYSE